MSASFPPTLFTIEELVNVVQLIIEMENAMKDTTDEDKNYSIHQKHKLKLKQNKKYKQRKAYHRSRFHHNIQQNTDCKYDDINIDDEKHFPLPLIPKPHSSFSKSSNIQRWISHRNKRDLLFMLASISGQTMKIYRKKDPIIEQINCRITMDGKYLMIGSEMIQMNKNVEISLGIDVCYADVKYIMNVLGIKCQKKRVQSKIHPNGDLHVNYTANSSGNTTGSSSDDHYIITKNHYKYGGKSYEIKSRLIRSKHCITIHEPYKRQTIIIQLCNIYDRRMWAQGLCYLKNLTPRARNFRWTVVAYLMAKYASTLLAHTKVNVKKKSVKMQAGSYGVPCYFEPFRQLFNALNMKQSDMNDKRYPKKYQQMFSRRQRRVRYGGTGGERFGENDIVYDPNKIVPLPEDEEKFYE